MYTDIISWYHHWLVTEAHHHGKNKVPSTLKWPLIIYWQVLLLVRWAPSDLNWAVQVSFQYNIIWFGLSLSMSSFFSWILFVINHRNSISPDSTATFPSGIKYGERASSHQWRTLGKQEKFTLCWPSIRTTQRQRRRRTPWWSCGVLHLL